MAAHPPSGEVMATARSAAQLDPPPVFVQFRVMSSVSGVPAASKVKKAEAELALNVASRDPSASQSQGSPAGG